MKLLISGCVLLAVLAGCKKEKAVKPEVGSQNLPTSAVILPTSLTYNIGFDLQAQKVTTRVDKNVLKLVYKEKVGLLVDAKEYERSWGLHLTEDFSTSALAGYNYTTVTKEGHTTLNWVDDNLNNVVLSGKADTTINGVKKLKVKIERTFTFTKSFDAAQQAISAQNLLLGRVNDVITLSSFYYSDDKKIQPSVVKAKVIYLNNTGL